MPRYKGNRTNRPGRVRSSQDIPDYPVQSSGRRSRTSLSVPDIKDPQRISLLWILFLILAVVIACRLVWLQVIDAPNINQTHGAKNASEQTITPTRGTIYDRNGIILATTVDAYNVYCHPHQVKTEDVNTLVDSLVATFGGEAEAYREKILQDANFAYLFKGATKDQMESIMSLKLEGVGREETTKRVYPCGSVASQIIGVVNSEGEAISGLELYYNDILGGTPGKQVTAYSKEGVPVPNSTHIVSEVVNGSDIVVSLDVELQEKLETEVLLKTKEVGGKTGFGVLMDGDTGEIYACASDPSFDITDLSQVKEGATNISGISLAYEPGSIFKPVTMLAALEEGTSRLGQEYYCPEKLVVGDYTITDSHDRDATTMDTQTIMAQSSNIGISMVAKDLSFSRLSDYIAQYKIVNDINIDYPGAASGHIADRESWSDVQGYNISFGQGLEVSPIQMTRFYAMLANNGTYVTPHFLLRATNEDANRSFEGEKIVDNDEAIDELEVMLEEVVKSGTATQAQIEGYRVAGKTGTAQVASDTGGYRDGVYNISFVGYLPDASKKFVCFVGATEVPGERKTVSAFRDIMSFAIDRYNVTQE